MALALIHHLAIGNNVPLSAFVDFFAAATREFALVEWVPKTDPMVERMLTSREDIFDSYDEDGFREACGERFSVVEEFEVADSQRRLFLLKLRSGS